MQTASVSLIPLFDANKTNNGFKSSEKGGDLQDDLMENMVQP